MYDLELLRLFEARFNLGCRNWYLLLLWRRYRSFEASSICERISVAREVLTTPGRGGVTWAWGGWLKLVDHLLNRLNDEDPHVRSEAAIALAYLRPASERTFVEMLRRLQSPTVTLHDRTCAAWALGRIGRDREVAVPALLATFEQMIGVPDANELRRCAAEAIETLSDDQDALIAAALLCLTDSFFKCKLVGLSLITRVFERRSELRPMVERLVTDEVEEVALAAKQVLIDFLAIELRSS